MTEDHRLEAIRRRHRKADPLNLSAVTAECPELLAGLYDPASFAGWRETLERAGLSYESIVIVPQIEVACLHCGHRDARIDRHLIGAHGLYTMEYRREFPEAEVFSEETRMRQMGRRYGKVSKQIVPHWEPAWSLRYALDRLHHYHRLGLPMNRAYWTKHEPALEGYLRRVFTHWEPVLEAIGLDPEVERKAKKIIRLEEKAAIRNKLAALGKKDPSLLRFAAASGEGTQPLIRSAVLAYGSYEAALEDAGIPPRVVIPELDDAEILSARERLLGECRQRLAGPCMRDEQWILHLYEEYEDVMRAFYGAWSTLIALLGSEPQQFFAAPGTEKYPDEAAVTKALKSRHAAGLPLDQLRLRNDNAGLAVRATQFFGKVSKALEAAGLQQLPHNFRLMHYKSPAEVLAALAARRESGASLYPVDLFAEREGKVLHKWALRYFGSYAEALAGIGVKLNMKPVDRSGQILYPTVQAVLDGIRARAENGLGLSQEALLVVAAEGGDNSLRKAGCHEFGTWDAALFEAGFYDVDHRPTKGPARKRFWTAADVVAALLEREAKGLGCDSPTLLGKKNKDSGLHKGIHKYFATRQEALVAAGMMTRAAAGTPPYDARDKCLSALRRRRKEGKPLDLPAMLTASRGDRPLAEAAHRHFGSWAAVLQALETRER